MIVIPAIDLHEGKVVRLSQGDFDCVTRYGRSPEDMARAFEDAGASRIHVVDLDGSLAGSGVNTGAIEKICSSASVDVELGGGIRSADDAKRAFDLGIECVILGTMIVRDFEASARLIEKFPGKVALGIDAKDQMVAVAGWKEITGIRAADLAKKYEPYNPAYIVYTDISKDGMMAGPNVEATRMMSEAVSTPVVASGGVSCIEDLVALKTIPGLMGAITGKAVYEGKLDLADAIKRIEMK